MSTLATLKAEIATDLGRPDLTTEITSAISAAIKHYQTERFWFCENRSATFTTESAKSSYSSSDNSDIPNFFNVDAVMFEESSTQEYPLDWIDQVDMEYRLGNSPASGEPDRYSYFDETFYLYPVPDAAYTVRPVGALIVAEPAADDEENNPWMVEGRELIRCKAKKLLYAHTIKDQPNATLMGAAEDQALNNLWAKTSRKRAKGRLRSTKF